MRIKKRNFEKKKKHAKTKKMKKCPTKREIDKQVFFRFATVP